MLMSHQNITTQKTWTFSNPNVRNSNLTKLSTVHIYDSDCLMLVCIWNALPSRIGSQGSMIGTETHYRLDGLETESQTFLHVIYVSITKHSWTNMYFVWFQASVAKMIVRKCAVLTQYVLSPHSFGQEKLVHLFKAFLPIQFINALFNASYEWINGKTHFYTVNATLTYKKKQQTGKIIIFHAPRLYILSI